MDEREAGLTRDELVDTLFAENVLARKYFFPGCHNMEPYRSSFRHAALVLPETREVVPPSDGSTDWHRSKRGIDFTNREDYPDSSSECS